jgi:transcriptional regulator with XRE-family HTH domain
MKERAADMNRLRRIINNPRYEEARTVVRSRGEKEKPMAKMKPKPKSEDQLLLGTNLERLRAQKDMTRKQLGKIVKVTEQQITRYETGGFVPLAMLERICETLDAPIQKKWIRRISALREQIKENGEGHEVLAALYKEVFLDDF